MGQELGQEKFGQCELRTLTYRLGEFGSLENVASVMFCFPDQSRRFSAGISENVGADFCLFAACFQGKSISFMNLTDHGDPISINTTEQRGARSGFGGMHLEKKVSPENKHSGD
jgi:hypothetical protein